MSMSDEKNVPRTASPSASEGNHLHSDQPPPDPAGETPALLEHPSCTFLADKKWLDRQYHHESQTIRKPDELQEEMDRPPGPIDPKILDKIQGSLIGMAIGDALGAHVEFRPYEYMKDHLVTDFEEGGTWGLKKGQFTDDTSMGLCLANSLIARRDFVPYDQLVRYKWWSEDGYMSSTGECFDIGAATSQSIYQFAKRQREMAKNRQIPAKLMDRLSDRSLLEEFAVYCSEEGVAGNGALMRLAPVPLFFFRNKYVAVEFSGRSGEITHGDRKATDACRFYGALIVAALRGYSKEQILASNFHAERRHWFGEEPLHPDVITIAQGSYKKPYGYRGGIRGKGYIINALEAALWAFWADEGSFEKGALLAVNLGDDTDTTAAIYGQLAGAYYGYEKIPDDWKRKLYAQDFILCIAEWLHCLGTRHPLETNLDKDDRSENNDQFQSNSTASLKKQTSLIEPSSSKPPLNRSISTDSNPNTAATRTGSSRPRLRGTPSGNSFDRDSFQGSQDEYRFYPNKD